MGRRPARHIPLHSASRSSALRANAAAASTSNTQFFSPFARIVFVAAALLCKQVVYSRLVALVRCMYYIVYGFLLLNLILGKPARQHPTPAAAPAERARDPKAIFKGRPKEVRSEFVTHS